MSTPTKQAPPVTAAKAAQAPTAPPASLPVDRKQRTSLPPVDFSDVSVSDGGVIKQDRKSALDGTPVRGWVKESRDNGNKVKTIQVKTTGVDTLKGMIQRAAGELDAGVRFGVAVALADKPGYSALPFATKDKKVVDMSEAAVAARKATRAANKAAKQSVAGK